MPEHAFNQSTVPPASSGEPRVRAAVVVPCFNHGRTLPALLSGVAALDLLIIVIDDGSTDDSSAALSQWAHEHPEVNLVRLRHERNRGKAAALQTGFDAAAELNMTHAVTIDADGQLEPADIPSLLAIAESSPRALVLGRRPEVMASCPGRCTVGRRFASLAIRAQCGLRLGDTQCGLRIYPLGLLRQVRCAGRRYAFEAEIITRAAWAGFPVLDAPVRCTYFSGADRVSHFRPWLDSLRQTSLHLRLVARALLPWTSRARAAAPPAAERRPLWRRAAHWLSPRRCLREARVGELGRLELAAALGIGAMIGSLPFFGLHTAMSIYTAWRLHLHPAGVVLGSQVSMPPLGVALAAASVWIGHLLLTGSVLRAGELDAQWASIPWFATHWLPAWLIGSVIVGLVVGAAVFSAAMLASARRPAATTPDPEGAR